MGDLTRLAAELAKLALGGVAGWQKFTRILVGWRARALGNALTSSRRDGACPMHDTASSPGARPAGLRRLWLYFSRASRLRCPHCGTKPMFVPLRRTRSLHDWFTPLDGCPRCGYAFEREIGYFLMAIWAVGYGFGALFGLAIYLYLELNYTLPISTLLMATLAPVLAFGLLFARHAKAYYLAFDHFVDPPVPDFDDAGPGDDKAPGSRPATPPAPASRATTDLIEPR